MDPVPDGLASTCCCFFSEMLANRIILQWRLWNVIPGNSKDLLRYCLCVHCSRRLPNLCSTSFMWGSVVHNSISWNSRTFSVSWAWVTWYSSKLKVLEKTREGFVNTWLTQGQFTSVLQFTGHKHLVNNYLWSVSLVPGTLVNRVKGGFWDDSFFLRCRANTRVLIPSPQTYI